MSDQVFNPVEVRINPTDNGCQVFVSAHPVAGSVFADNVEVVDGGGIRGSAPVDTVRIVVRDEWLEVESAGLTWTVFGAVLVDTRPEPAL